MALRTLQALLRGVVLGCPLILSAGTAIGQTYLNIDTSFGSSGGAFVKFSVRKVDQAAILLG
jgi:hypothetical protein